MLTNQRAGSCSYKTAVIEIILIIYLDLKHVQQNNPMKEGLVVCSKYNKNDYNNNNIQHNHFKTTCQCFPLQTSVSIQCVLIKVWSKQQLNTKSFVQYSCLVKVGLMQKIVPFGFTLLVEHTSLHLVNYTVQFKTNKKRSHIVKKWSSNVHFQ